MLRQCLILCRLLSSRCARAAGGAGQSYGGYRQCLTGNTSGGSYRADLGTRIGLRFAGTRTNLDLIADNITAGVEQARAMCTCGRAGQYNFTRPG